MAAHPVDLSPLQQAAGRAARLLKTLGILQPTLSQQLGVLRREALVATRRAGKQVYYRITDPAALALIHTLYRQFCTEECP